jgi:hypothetical protein
VKGTGSLSNDTDQQRNGSYAMDLQDSALEVSAKEPFEWSDNSPPLFFCFSAVGLERGPLSLVRSIEELLE